MGTEASKTRQDEMQSTSGLVDLSKQNMTDSDLERFTTLTQTHTLILANCKHITDSGLAHLIPLHGLTSLDLSGVTLVPPVDDWTFSVGIDDPDFTGTEGSNAENNFRLGKERLPNLRQLTQLKSLSLEGNDKLFPTSMRDISCLTNLTELNLKNCRRVTNSFLALLLPCLPNLTSLNLLGCDRVGDLGLSAMTNLHELETLQLHGPAWYEYYNPPVTDAGVKALARITSLRNLFLGCCKNITPTSLVSLGSMSGLTELNLSGFRFTSSPIPGGYENLETLQNLTSLDLRLLPITDEGLKSIGRITSLTRLSLAECKQFKDISPLSNLVLLNYLTLQSTKLPEAQLTPISGLTKLEVLKLDGIIFTEVGAASLVRLKGLRNLKLFWGECTDSAIEKISHLTKLTKLNLHGNRLTNKGLAHLTKMKNLTWLSLGNSQEFDEIGLRQLFSLEKLNYVDTRSCEKISLPFFELRKQRREQGKIAGLTAWDRDPCLPEAELENLFTIIPKVEWSLVGLSMPDFKNLAGVSLRFRRIFWKHFVTSMNVPFHVTNSIAALQAAIYFSSPVTCLAGRRPVISPAILPLTFSIPSLTKLSIHQCPNMDSRLAEVTQLIFLETLELTDCKLESLVDLRGLSKLTSLNLCRNEIAPETLTSISSLSKLGTLDLFQNNLSSVENLSEMTSLTDLNVGWFRGKDLTPLTTLTNLRRLNVHTMGPYFDSSNIFPHFPFLESAVIDRISSTHISAFPPNMKTLTIASSVYESSKIQLLSKLTNITSLKLAVGYFPSVLETPLGSLTNLTSLDLTDESGCGDIYPINFWLGPAKLTNLVHFRLEASSINGIFFESISRLKNLESIIIDFKPYNSTFPTKVANYFSRLRKLRRLIIPEMVVTEEEARCLSKLKNLRELNIIHEVTNRTVKIFESLPNLESLKLGIPVKSQYSSLLFAEKAR